MSAEVILVEKSGRVATIILNRPEKRNSLSGDMILKLNQNLEALAQDEQLRVLVIKGAGDKAFCSGYDISSLPTNPKPDSRDKSKRESLIEIVLDRVENFPYPTIAMLNGAAFGAGCELATCCDLRIGADDISMGMPPAKIGLVYSWKGLQRFINLTGLSRAKEIFLTGRAFKGERLLQLGLVDYLIPRNDLEPHIMKLASEITENAPLSLKGIKKVLNFLARSAKLSAAEQAEADALVVAAFRSEDVREGQRAFFEKRKPSFKGI